MNKLYFTTAVMILLSVFTLKAQESPDQVMPPLPMELIAREHLEGIMSRNLEMTMLKYHKNVELYKYPGTKLATGIVEAKKYWELQFAEKKELSYEPRHSFEVGNKLFIQVRKIEPKLSVVMEMAVIMEMKDGKIFRFYFVE